MAATGRWALHLTPRAHKTRQRFPRPLRPSRRACVEQSTVDRSSLAPQAFPRDPRGQVPTLCSS